MSVKRYVLLVRGCVEPELVGPFKTAKLRDEEAKKLRDADEDDGVFWLNSNSSGKVQVGAFTNGFMEGDPDFEGSEGNKEDGKPDTVLCKFCHKEVPAKTAHLHQGGWVGDACCWDERLKASE